MASQLCTIETWLKFPEMTWADYDDMMAYVATIKGTERIKRIFDRHSNIKPFEERTKEYMWEVLKGNIKV